MLLLPLILALNAAVLSQITVPPDMKVSLLSEGGGWAPSVQVVFRKGNGKAEVAEDAHHIQGPNDPQGARGGRLLTGQFDRKGGPEVIADLTYEFNSGGPPEALHVFALTPRPHETDLLRSNQEILIKKLANGETAFIVSHEIGGTLCHANMPRWQDAYALRGGKFRMVESGLESFYRGWATRLWDLLLRKAIDPDFSDERPQDTDIWSHYGLALRRAGIHRSFSGEVRRLANLVKRDYPKDWEDLKPDFTKLEKRRGWPRVGETDEWLPDSGFYWLAR
ncbi:MAG TPA: hypothetical protein VGL56_13585 [Fimbriimonadaceae bacterium]|jgi:hypothetical protein